MTAKSMEFKTEVKQLLDLMIHSLYSHKEIFLRELVSNASDAIDKARYESLTNESIMEGEDEWKVKISVNKEEGTLTISDNGIGMTEEDVVTALGTIAHSGTKEFMKLLQSKEAKDNPELIGQFGVGFYSAFMVADKVTVVTRKAGAAASEGVCWESEADGTYTVETIEKNTKGTDVILTLKEDETKYLEEWEIRSVIKKYSDYIEHPVVMDVEKTIPAEEEGGESEVAIEEETLNSMKALWLKSPSEIEKEEYDEFYKHVSHDFTEPAKTIHYRAEGMQEFTVLLFLPKKAPLNILYPDFKAGPTLYVKRVQIMDSCEDLIPKYLRFIKGVVDSADLPLNVSREILQNNKLVEQMKKNITKKVLDTLKEMKTNEYDDYLQFYGEFSRVLKEGIHYDFSKKADIASLLLFESTQVEAGDFTTLADYITRMKSDQEDIYYITGSSRDELAKSPYLEALEEKGYEVLFMTDEIDDFIISELGEFEGKKFKSVFKGDIKLDDEEDKKEELGDLIGFIKDALGDKVEDVRLSGRLKNSACCLVSGDNDMDPKMRMLMEQMGQDVPPVKRVLEINPHHELFNKMNVMLESDKEALDSYAKLLFEQANILEGGKPEDPAEFAKLLSKVLSN